MKVHILDYGLGNIKSLSNALAAVGADVEVVTDFTVDEVQKLIIPGVGSFSKAMSLVRGKKIDVKILEFAQSGKPLLGICLGMQILATGGSEGGFTPGLNLIKGRVVPFDLDTCPLIPNVGFSEVNLLKDGHPLFNNLKKDPSFYFTHSYFFSDVSDEDILCVSYNGVKFAAGVNRKNITGLQFHPEISQDQGLKVLENFCKS